MKILTQIITHDLYVICGKRVLREWVTPCAKTWVMLYIQHIAAINSGVCTSGMIAFECTEYA